MTWSLKSSLMDHSLWTTLSSINHGGSWPGGHRQNSKETEPSPSLHLQAMLSSDMHFVQPILRANDLFQPGYALSFTAHM